MIKFTDFEKELIDVCVGWIGEEPGFESYIHDCSKKLLQLATAASLPLWAARDKNGSLWFYKNKPFLRDDGTFWTYDPGLPTFFSIDDRLLPEVTFENSPKLVNFLVCES